LRFRKALFHPTLLTAAGVVRDRDARFIEIVDRLGSSEFRVGRQAEHADAGTRVDDEIDDLEALGCFGQGRDRDIDLVGGEHRHLGFVAHRNRFQLHVKAPSVFARQHPGRAAPGFAPARCVFD
jgi:hypothetical protein